jgi:hypothetical protein
MNADQKHPSTPRRGNPSVRIVAAALIWSALAPFAAAVNLAFMPGDAFFGATLTESLVDTLPTQDASILLEYRYRYRLEDGTFGGYAGFHRLRIKESSLGITGNLQKLYRYLRRDFAKEVRIEIDQSGNRIETEINPFDLLVYNREVDWKNQRLALKYNEDWRQLPESAVKGPPRWNYFGGKGVRAERYLSYLPIYEAVIDDWKHAAEVAPLRVQVPENVAWGIAGPEIDEPVVIQADAVQLIILPSDDLKAYFHETEQFTFYSITEDGVHELSWQDGTLAVKNCAELNR